MSVSDAPRPVRRPLEERPLRVVSARPSLVRRCRSIWDARELLSYFVASDIKIKYKSSVLGIVWSMVAPAVTLIMYFVVFQIVMKSGIPQFAVFLFSGLLVWNFFMGVLGASTSIVVDRASIVKKVSFPREILALSTVGTALVYFLIQCLVMAIFLAIIGHAPAWGLLWLLPLAMLALASVVSALGIFLSAANVYLRDTKHLVDVVVQLWFWMSPIVYSYQNTVAPMLQRHGLTWMYFLNPVNPAVMTFQRVLYRSATVASTTPSHLPLHLLPTWSLASYVEMNLIILGVGCVALAAAVSFFGRVEGNFAEEL